MVKKIIFILFLLTMLASLGHAASRTDALLAINQSQNDMKEMIGAGFFANSVNDTIGAMRQALERADFAEMLRQNATGSLAEQARKALEGLNYEGFTYDSVVAYGNQTAVRKQKAFELHDSIRALEIRIGNTFGLNLSDATALIGQAKEEIVATKDIFVQPVLPNLFRTGDSVIVSAIVNNYSDVDREFELNLEFDSGRIASATQTDIIKFSILYAIIRRYLMKLGKLRRHTLILLMH